MMEFSQSFSWSLGRYAPCARRWLHFAVVIHTSCTGWKSVSCILFAEMFDILSACCYVFVNPLRAVLRVPAAQSLAKLSVTCSHVSRLPDRGYQQRLLETQNKRASQDCM